MITLSEELIPDAVWRGKLNDAFTKAQDKLITFQNGNKAMVTQENATFLVGAYIGSLDLTEGAKNADVFAEILDVLELESLI